MRNYINGKWVDYSGKLFAKINPASEVVSGAWPESNEATVLDAVNAAREAQKFWRQLSRIKRADYFETLMLKMREHQSEIVSAIVADTGKNTNEATAEFNESVHMVQYTFAQGREPYGTFVGSEIAEKDIVVFRKPKGVVAVISPFNFPCAIGGFWTSAPAILEGNTVILKPSEDAPATADVIAKMYQEAGFPAGVFNLIHGKGETGSYLVNADVNHICFTGSVKVGQYIRKCCADSLNKSCSCEMGSKSAVVVFEDINMDLALDACIASAFKLSGQRCVSASRILVQRRIVDQFAAKFVEKAKQIAEGIGNLKSLTGFEHQNPTAYYGPLISKEAVQRVVQYNMMVMRDMDAKVLMDGSLQGNTDISKGYYLGPFVYKTEWYDNKRYLKEEVFGPHVAIIPFDTVDDAVKIYNDTDFGLSMAVLTQNMSVARYMRDNCEYGLGYHNLPCIGAESHIPFGGVKASGYGGASAAGSFKTTSHEVTWTANFDPNGFRFCQGMK
jgi:aldehyde dehydrogenase (NAD+)